MPRQGDGSADNAIDPGHNIIHGAGQEQLSSRVNRADKAAPMPEPEKGAGIPGMNASGGQSQGRGRGPTRGQGKGPAHPDA
ncbi:hypothetical protein VTK26DRAFT_1060 [Humicola hyalothermophila]